MTKNLKAAAEGQKYESCIDFDKHKHVLIVPLSRSQKANLSYTMTI